MSKSNYRDLKIPQLKNLIQKEGGFVSRYNRKDDLIKYLTALKKHEKCDTEKECSDNGKCIVENKGLPGLCIPESLNNVKNQTESYNFNGKTFYGTKKAINKLTKILRQPSPRRSTSPARRSSSPGAPSRRTPSRRTPSPRASSPRASSVDSQIFDYIRKFGGENTEMINKNDLISFISNAMKGNRCKPENDEFCGDGQSCDITYSPGICVPSDEADKMSKYPGVKFFDIGGERIHGPQSSINRMRQMREEQFPYEEEKYPEDSDDDFDGQIITDIDPFASSVRTRAIRTTQSPPKSPTPVVSPTPKLSPDDVQSMLSQLQGDNISSIDELSETNKQVLKCLGLLG